MGLNNAISLLAIKCKNVRRINKVTALEYAKLQLLTGNLAWIVLQTVNQTPKYPEN